jgi:hypothetical protein
LSLILKSIASVVPLRHNLSLGPCAARVKIYPLESGR